MNEGYVKVSWENNAKTGAAENVVIDTEASATEEATVACLMVRHACETIAQYSGKEKAKKCLLETVKIALDATDEEIEAQAKTQGKDGGDNEWEFYQGDVAAGREREPADRVCRDGAGRRVRVHDGRGHCGHASVVSVMEKQVGREQAKADLLGMIRLMLEQDDKEILSEGVTIALPRRVKPE